MYAYPSFAHFGISITAEGTTVTRSLKSPTLYPRAVPALRQRVTLTPAAASSFSVP